MKRVTLADFPGAPPGSWVCREGWLIVGDEAWLLSEWLNRGGRPIEYHDHRHRAQRDRKRQRYATDPTFRAFVRQRVAESKRRRHVA